MAIPAGCHATLTYYSNLDQASGFQLHTVNGAAFVGQAESWRRSDASDERLNVLMSGFMRREFV